MSSNTQPQPTDTLRTNSASTKSTLEKSFAYLTTKLSAHEHNITLLYNRSHISTRTHSKSISRLENTHLSPPWSHKTIDQTPLNTLENIHTLDLINLKKELTYKLKSLFTTHDELLDIFSTTEDLFIVYRDILTAITSVAEKKALESTEEIKEMMSYFKDTERRIARMRGVLAVFWGRLQEVKRAWEGRVGGEIFISDEGL